MRRLFAALIVGVAAWIAVPHAVSARGAQSRPHPNFSGSWVLVRDDITKAAGAKEPLSVFTFGDSLTIQQDNASIAIAIWKVRLDGVIAQNPDGSTTKAAWDGDTLVLVETEAPSGTAAPPEHRCGLQLASDGTLVIELTSKPVQDAVLIRSTFTRAPGTSAPVVPNRQITDPEPIHREDGKYTSAAMRAKIEGSVTLRIVVLQDGTVDPNAITVLRSLDAKLGLDDEAIAAVKRWTFKPATLIATGQPVKCQLTVEMIFKLH